MSFNFQGNMPYHLPISEFIQTELKRKNMQEISAINAAQWLDRAGLLKDSLSRPGKPLRDLLRSKKIVGQKQLSNRRWFIECVDITHRDISKSTRILKSTNVPRQNMSGLDDILEKDLKIVFVGTTVGVKSSQQEHYYSHPTNYFYREIAQSGLTDRLLMPVENSLLPNYGIGLTDLVKNVVSSNDSSLRKSDYESGIDTLTNKILKYQPFCICFNGKTAFREYSGLNSFYGIQDLTIDATIVFIVPSTSGCVSSKDLFDGYSRSNWFRLLFDFLNE